MTVQQRSMVIIAMIDLSSIQSLLDNDDRDNNLIDLLLARALKQLERLNVC